MTGIYDIHCHILPGVDDGSPDMDTSLAMLRKEADDGVSSIILTPHYRRRMFETPLSVLVERFIQLRRGAQQEGIAIRLYLGCEYHVNMDMVEGLQKGHHSTMAGSRYVLTEFREDAAAQFVRERTMALIGSGYVPIIAHVERITSVREDFDLIDELRERGCRIQMNADTISGKDGWGMKRFAKKMVKYDLLDFAGSDGHNMKERMPHMGDCARTLIKWGGEDYARHILIENPDDIIQNV